ncbi:2Fe-2S iron-sulfur cluster binding domain-containing protein [Olavius sp. associated proteobacterium Delta 1]|nr:2Fe-2S iron-sulfur cluster binding domain-containing protein [Olavius sp. associated proteobacterium Delta 1]
MPIKKVIFKILRYKPGHIDPARFQEFTLEVDPATSVLDALEFIRLKQDSTLMYRHSCHHSSCGTCACRINGIERLTCITKIQELADDTITLTPLEGFKPIGDLVVDMNRFYDDISEEWSYLKKAEKVKSIDLPAGIGHFSRFENCIECGACVSACPVRHKNAPFIGPAVLAALNCELKKAPQGAKDLMAIAGSKRGEHLCERALNCSRVCPTGVYPARHIADLRRLIEKKNLEKTANPK